METMYENFETESRKVEFGLNCDCEAEYLAELDKTHSDPSFSFEVADIYIIDPFTNDLPF